MTAVTLGLVVLAAWILGNGGLLLGAWLNKPWILYLAAMLLAGAVLLVVVLVAGLSIGLIK